MRVGYYGPEHIAALRLIRELQDDGFNLAAIKQLLSDRERTEERLARFRSSLTRHTEAEPGETMTGAELRERLGVSGQEGMRVLARVQQLGAVVPSATGSFSVPSPSLLALAEQAVASGISLGGAIDVFEDAQEHVDAVATAFVRLFASDVWREFRHEGMPVRRWPEVEDAIERLRGLATEAIADLFARRLNARIDDAFGADGDRSDAPVAGG